MAGRGVACAVVMLIAGFGGLAATVARADTVLTMEGITSHNPAFAAMFGFYKTNTYTEAGFSFDNFLRNSASNDELVSWTSTQSSYTGGGGSGQALLSNYGGENATMTSVNGPFTVLSVDLAQTNNLNVAFAGTLTGKRADNSTVSQNYALFGSGLHTLNLIGFTNLVQFTLFTQVQFDNIHIADAPVAVPLPAAAHAGLAGLALVAVMPLIKKRTPERA